MLLVETEAVLDMLKTLYIPEGIFLQSVLGYSSYDRTLEASFCVPERESYVAPGIVVDYVTTEQFIRCISQLSCSLVFLLSQGGIRNFDFIKHEHFERVWYRETTLTYKRHILKEKSFEIYAIILDAYEMRQFWVTHIRISGAVHGEIEFVLRR